MSLQCGCAVGLLHQICSVHVGGQINGLRGSRWRGNQLEPSADHAKRTDAAAGGRQHDDGIELKPKAANPLLGQVSTTCFVSTHPGHKGASPGRNRP